MASERLRRYYRQERTKGATMVGFAAVQAYRNAIDRIKWEALQRIGAVRLWTEPDFDCDLSYLDDDSYSDREGRAIAKRTRDRAERDGCWGLIGQYRTDFDNVDDDGCWEWHPSDVDDDSGRVKWRCANSIWGFVGDDWQNSGYDDDIRAAAIKAFRDAWKAYLAARKAAQQEERERSQGICPACHGTGKYPAGSVGARRDDPITRIN